jgi:uncharacterized membrane protein
VTLNFLTPTRLASFWSNLRTSFWFVPSAMAAGAIALSHMLVQLDIWFDDRAGWNLGWLYASGAEGARALLSVIASSMITVAGLTFSITMLTLQLASSQFGPRVLRNFMRDRGNQIVLGTFVATFLYCLLVLRTVRGPQESNFVPHLAVAFAVLLAIAGIGVLIYFIHHVASSIRVENLLVQLAGETRSAIDRLYPERADGELPSVAKIAGGAIPEDFDGRARPVGVGRSGYIQAVDLTALMRIAAEQDLLLRIEAPPGRFIRAGDAVLTAYPVDRVPEEYEDELKNAFVIGQNRTPGQDLEFSIRRIVEMAQRSLSPGVNDPTTALYCIDRLGEALMRLCRRDLPSPLHFDKKGQLRLITEVVGLAAFACPPFAAIARYGLADADVIARLLLTMDMVSKAAGHEAGKPVAALREGSRAESQKRIALGFDRETIEIAPLRRRPPS